MTNCETIAWARLGPVCDPPPLTHRAVRPKVDGSHLFISLFQLAMREEGQTMTPLQRPCRQKAHITAIPTRVYLCVDRAHC